MIKNIRQSAVAGQFYPAEAKILKQKIEGYLATVATTSPTSPPPAPFKGGENPPNTLSAQAGVYQGGIRAIIVPHAGYDYSGPVAAYAYQTIKDRQTKTAVIICNSHSSYFTGLAIDANDVWQTPLGEVTVDKELADKLIAADNDLKYNGDAHRTDHSLEVQLPFLQTVLPAGFKIVPILFGNTGGDSYKKLVQALADNLEEGDLVVISTDMSHYPRYEDANKIDQATLAIVKSLDVAELEKYITTTENAGYTNEQTLICGVDGVKTVMALAKLENWSAEILKYANSGDSSLGSHDQVVGYGAIAFIATTSGSSEAQATESIDIFTEKQKEVLLDIAKTTVEGYVKNHQVPNFNITDERLLEKQGAFVTLKKDGNLRGCIGQIVPSDKPLWQVVRDMAVAAASEDPRFNPVNEAELSKLEYEVSVLSVPEKIDDWRKIELGKHGVIIKKGWHSGVFLPQVATETGWGLEEFLEQLSWQKAGLPPDAYKNDKGVELEVFTAAVF